MQFFTIWTIVIEVIMMLPERKRQILTILRDNLESPQPNLVSSATIAARLQLDIKQIRPHLRQMEGMGVIQVDPDLDNSLITRQGLCWLDMHGTPHKSSAGLHHPGSGAEADEQA